MPKKVPSNFIQLIPILKALRAIWMTLPFQSFSTSKTTGTCENSTSEATSFLTVSSQEWLPGLVSSRQALPLGQAARLVN